MFFCGLTDGTNACRSRLTAHTYRKSIVYEKKKCLRTLIPKHAHPTGLYPLCQLEVLLMEGRVWDAFRTLPRDWAWESCTTPEASSRPRRRTLGENAAFTQSSSREATGSITNQHRATNVWLGAFSILPSCDIFFSHFHSFIHCKCRHWWFPDNLFFFFVKLTINCDLVAQRYMQVSEFFCWMSVCLSDCLTMIVLYCGQKKLFLCIWYVFFFALLFEKLSFIKREDACLIIYI